MRVLFPFQALDDIHEAEAESAANEWRGSGKILIVDDEESVRILGQRVLSRAGFETLLAEDGRQALKIFKEHSDEICLVLLDMTMPYLNGLETYDQLRKIRKDIRTILCSGYNEQEIAGHELADGLAGFIKKPFRVESLITAVREVLAERKRE
jgi:DNA-binding NtrC family response regulator